VIVASSRDELIGRNLARCDCLDAARLRPEWAKLYVSTPFRSSLGPFVVVVARVVTGPTGEFAGAVTATLDPDYFDVVLRSVIYAPDMVTTLVHGSGKALLIVPSNERALGSDLARPDALFERHRKSGQSATLATGRVFADDENRIASMRTINSAELGMDPPLVAVLSRGHSAVFSAWRAKALRFAIFFAVICLASGLGVHFSGRQRREVERLTVLAAEERQRGAERVELALHGADLGLWDLQLARDELVVNERERALLGYARDDELPPASGWRALIHPDDLPALQAAIDPHVQGKTAVFECEHRMRHRAGDWIWVLSRGMVVERDAACAPVRLVGTHLDLTERKRAEAELARAVELLRDSQRQLQQMTDNLPALVSRLDLELRFRFANRAYRDWLGIEPTTLLGRSVQEVYGEQACSGFRHYLVAALGGTRVVYEREMATPHGRRHVEVTVAPQYGGASIIGLYVLIHDITARHDAQLEHARSEQRLSLALEGSGHGLFDWDVRCDRIYHSAQATALCGNPAVAMTASTAEIRSHVHADDVAPMLARIKDALTGAAPDYDAEFRIRHRTGAWLWLRARGRVVERDNAGRAVRLAGTYADISESKLADARLRRLAEYDVLTDLPNRALFHDRLQQAMLRTARDKPMALLFLDIDHFKTINDTLGHEAGDRLLKVFAQRMRAAVRKSDTVARLAGDEFTVILEGLRDLADAKAFAQKLVEVAREPVLLAATPIEVTTSIGIAMCITGDSDDAALLRRADMALYEAKRLGRNGYFCDPTDTHAGPFLALVNPPKVASH
jgi:diguanylate cyclase (GGDEF)-like protein/PAS domain S-box-containing protein